jgi:hypothetical protein
MWLANESIENAENHFNKQEYVECAIEVTKAENHLLYRDNSSSEERGMNIVRACELLPDDFHRFESSLFPVAAYLGDGYIMPRRSPQTNFQIDRENAEFLLNFAKKLISKIQGLE